LNRQKKGKRIINTSLSAKHGTPGCPICHSENYRGVYPGIEHLCRCRQCGAAFNREYRPREYHKSYFVDEYRSQYGKTYEEDAAAIKALSRNRLDRIFRLLGPQRERQSLRLLDIGSAMGFFLSEASEAGIGVVEGLEVSGYAAAYCRKRLKLSVRNSTFENARLTQRYDVITAWYFIEHCPDPGDAVRKIHGLLTKGGIFAMATPSLFGPLYMCDRRAWIESHPSDHRVDFSPRSIRRILAGAGFSGISVRAAGVHPERVLRRDSVFYGPFSGLYTGFSKIARFSDTMEVFAVR
jgi:SAM-dependent methyltransferase